MQGNPRTSRKAPAHKLRWSALLGIVVLLTAPACSREEPAPVGGGGVPHLAKIHAGSTAPAFQAKTLSGRTINFPADYRGKVVLVDFWATWCVPCIGEFPHLLEAREKFQERGFEIIAISTDQPTGTPVETVRAFLKERKIPWEVVYDGAQQIAADYRVGAIPAPFLIDGDTGSILATKLQARGPELLDAIEKALKNKPD